MSGQPQDDAAGPAKAAWDLNACSELSANFPGGDSALQSRMQSLLQQARGHPCPDRRAVSRAHLACVQVDVAAKAQTNGASYLAANRLTLEQLASTNRTQSAQIQALSQAHAAPTARHRRPSR